MVLGAALIHHGPAAGAGPWLCAALRDAGGGFAPALLSPGLAVLGVGWLGRSVPLEGPVIAGSAGAVRIWVPCGHAETLPCPVWLLPRSPGTALWSQMKSEILL